MQAQCDGMRFLGNRQAYARAGVDGLFAFSLADIAWIPRLAKETFLPFNLTVGDATPSMRLLAENGLAR
jgi:2-methylisocitrate lyase-like PEP mutase family enzyme